jgi:hypothetical protein
MRPWHSNQVFALCCGVLVIVYLKAPAYLDTVGAVVLALFAAYLWFTRWLSARQAIKLR